MKRAIKIMNHIGNTSASNEGVNNKSANKEEAKSACSLSYSLGYSLIELMVTIAVFAILASVAAPTFSNFIGKRNLDAQSSGFEAVLTSARSTAVTRPSNVVVCWNLTAGVVPFPAATGIALNMQPFSISSALTVGGVDQLEQEFVFNAPPQQILNIIDTSPTDCVTYTPRGALNTIGSAFVITFVHPLLGSSVVLTVPANGRPSSVTTFNNVVQ